MHVSSVQDHSDMKCMLFKLEITHYCDMKHPCRIHMFHNIVKMHVSSVQDHGLAAFIWPRRKCMLISSVPNSYVSQPLSHLNARPWHSFARCWEIVSHFDSKTILILKLRCESHQNFRKKESSTLIRM